MKKIFFFLLIFSFGALQAQFNQDAPWMQNIIQKKSQNPNYKPTFKEVQQAFNAYWKTHDPNAKGSGYKPFKRWEYIWEHVVDDEGYLPTVKDQWVAWEHKKAIQKASTDLSSWQAFGPFTHTNTGSWSSGQARINTIIVDPNVSTTWYVGAPAGGLWKSTNSGVDWSPLTDNLPQIGVSGIAIDYNNSNIIYIATGDDDGADTLSAGVFKSTDAGQTWNQTGLNPENTPSSMNDIYMHPTNSNVLWVATNNGVFKSTNAGSTWNVTLAGNIKDIKLKPGDPNTIYAVTTNEFYKSTDGGDSFTQITNGVPTGSGRMVIDVTPADANYVYILSAASDRTIQGVYRSVDSGTTFSARNTTTDVLESNQAFYDLALGVSSTDAEEIYVGCLNVWKSINGGTLFTKVNNWSSPFSSSYTHADIHMIRDFNGSMYVCSDGGIYSTTNGGSNFTDHTGGIQASQFYKIAVSPDNANKMVGGLQDNGGHAYNNGNGNWQNYYGADGMDTAIDPTNENKYYGFIQNGGGLYISSTAGSSSTGYADPPIGADGNWVTPLAMDSNGELYAGYDKLYRLNADENGWIELADLGASANQMEIAPSDDTVLYIAVGTVLKKSNDSGSTVADVFTFANTIKGIAVHHTNPNIVWVTTSSAVFRSDDGGSTFDNITKNLPATDKYFFLNDIVHQSGSAQDAIYLATSIGVYRNVTDGVWTPFFNNLPTTIVTDLEINILDNSITAATYGRGIWRSSLPSCTTVVADQATSIDGATFEERLSLGLCTGQSATLQLTVTTGNNPTYNWSGPNGFSSSASSVTLSDLSMNQAGLYTVAVNSPETCGAVDYNFSIDLQEAIQPIATDIDICNNNTATLTANGSAGYKWYDSASSGTEIATGSSFTTPALNTNTTYFVSGLSKVIVSEASPSPAVNTAADYNFPQGLIFNANDDIVLESFTMSAMSSGDRLIQVNDAFGNIIASTTINIPAGESLVTVNFDIPQGDGHVLSIPSGLVEMRRTPSGNGVSYPYTSPSDVVSIIGNTVNAPEFYYFFYDWNFTSKGGRCESVRTPININVNADNPDLSDGDTLYAIDGGSTTSFSDGATIMIGEDSDLELSLPASQFSGSLIWTAPGGATYTTNTVNLTNIQDNGDEEGNWTVAVTFAPNCGTATQTINFRVNVEATLSTNENSFEEGLIVYPNPVEDILIINSPVSLTNTVASIVDIQGRKLSTSFDVQYIHSNQIEINTKPLAKGHYFVIIKNDQKQLVKKIVKR
ncbi:T9SS type A sorting domain-containing protein [Aquimarina sp. MMG016]|nr:T9SS type A sorting domain-containing protein [Aquimarina sp. MMG016]